MICAQRFRNVGQQSSMAVMKRAQEPLEKSSCHIQYRSLWDINSEGIHLGRTQSSLNTRWGPLEKDDRFIELDIPRWIAPLVKYA